MLAEMFHTNVTYDAKNVFETPEILHKNLNLVVPSI